MRNKFFTLFIILIFSIFLFSCGGKGGNGDSGDQKEGDSASSEVTKAAEETTAEPTNTAETSKKTSDIDENNLPPNAVKAKALVEKGIAYVKSDGKDKAWKEFSVKTGSFVDGEFYLFVVDFKGLTLAHGGNDKLVGKNMFDAKDPDGVFFIQEFINVARDKSTGWIDYKWSNPTTKKVEAKTSYVQRVEGEDIFIGCGFYK